MNDIVEDLVTSRGIESTFVDAWGKPAVVKDSTKQKLLRAMGYSIDEQELLAQQVDEQLTNQWLTMLNPVQVIKYNEPFTFPMRVGIELASNKFSVVLTLETGETSEFEVEPVDHVLVNVAQLEDDEIQEYAVTLPQNLPMGYHLLAIKHNNTELATSKIIKTPQKCFIPEAIEQGRKIWGLSVQLYCVRSRRNWGIGDFTDLINLVENAAEQGADFVGLNPIHELYPANPDACSPYGPSSRRWLNCLYIDVESVAEFSHASVQSWFKEEQIEKRLNELRATEYVDYEGVAALKLEAFNRVFSIYKQKYLSKNTKQNKAFKAFVAEGGKAYKP